MSFSLSLMTPLRSSRCKDRFPHGCASDAGKQITSVVGGDVVDELHNDDSLSDAGSSGGQSSSLCVRRKEVDIDSRDEDLGGLLLGESSEGLWMGKSAWYRWVRVELSNDVHDASERLRADEVLMGAAVIDGLATDESISSVHSKVRTMFSPRAAQPRG